MKTLWKSLLLGLAVACPASLTLATPVTLEDFTAFASPDTYFLGDWELNGDGGGTNDARASFSQGAGFYSFDGGSNDQSASAFRFFSALDITGNSLLQFSAQLLAGNTASSFTISLFDSAFESAFAVFSTADFTDAGFTSVSSALTFAPGFNLADLSSYQISGNAVGGTEVLSFAADHLTATAPAATVPDSLPMIYGLAAGLGGLGLMRRLTIVRTCPAGAR